MKLTVIYPIVEHEVNAYYTARHVKDTQELLQVSVNAYSSCLMSSCNSSVKMNYIIESIRDANNELNKLNVPVSQSMLAVINDIPGSSGPPPTSLEKGITKGVDSLQKGLQTVNDANTPP